MRARDLFGLFSARRRRKHSAAAQSWGRATWADRSRDHRRGDPRRHEAGRARTEEIFKSPGAKIFRASRHLALAASWPSSKRPGSSPARNSTSTRAGIKRNLPFLKAPHGCFIK